MNGINIAGKQSGEGSLEKVDESVGIRHRLKQRTVAGMGLVVAGKVAIGPELFNVGTVAVLPASQPCFRLSGQA